MFCPHCGVKNNGSPSQCAICKKLIPSLDGPTATAIPREKPRNEIARLERLGSVGDRMIALAMDRVAIAAILLMVGAWIAENWSEIQPRLPSLSAAGAMGAGIVLLGVFLYHLVLESAFGMTLGKAVMGLQVVNQGERAKVTSVALRNLLRVVDSQALYLIGFLAATFTRHRQRVGDLAAGTVVLDVPMARGARAAMIVLWLTVLISSVWVAFALCPSCGDPAARIRSAFPMS